MKKFEKLSSVTAQLRAYRALKSRATTPVNGLEPHPTTTDFFRNLMQMWENKHTEEQHEKQLEELSL